MLYCVKYVYSLRSAVNYACQLAVRFGAIAISKGGQRIDLGYPNNIILSPLDSVEYLYQSSWGFSTDCRRNNFEWMGSWKSEIRNPWNPDFHVIATCPPSCDFMWSRKPTRCLCTTSSWIPDVYGPDEPLINSACTRVFAQYSTLQYQCTLFCPIFSNDPRVA